LISLCCSVLKLTLTRSGKRSNPTAETPRFLLRCNRPLPCQADTDLQGPSLPHAATRAHFRKVGHSAQAEPTATRRSGTGTTRAARASGRRVAARRPTPSSPTTKRRRPTAQPPPSATTASPGCVAQSSAAARSTTCTATRLGSTSLTPSAAGWEHWAKAVTDWVYGLYYQQRQAYNSPRSRINQDQIDSIEEILMP